jgi:hypothetical protein
MSFRNCHSTTAFLGICSAISIISVSAGTGYAQDQCLDSIELVKRDIQGRIGAVVPHVENMSDADFYGSENARSPFTEADRIVVFYLASHMAVGKTAPTKRQGLAAENIIASPLLTRTYAKQIIEACKSVASVKFHYYEWFQGWSLHKGKMLKEDKCLENTRSRREVSWGENLCL